MKAAVFLVVVLLLGLVGFLFLSKSRDNTPKITDEAATQTVEVENKIEEIFGRNIPDDVEKLSLTDLTNESLLAIATRKEESGSVEFSVLADLPENQESYEVWAGASSQTAQKIGSLISAKAGYIFEENSLGALSDFEYVAIMRSGQKMLEGSF